MLRNGINDFNLTVLDRLSIVGSSGMGALRYEPETVMEEPAGTTDFDLLQQKALEVLGEKNTEDASLLYFNSQNSGGCRPKVVFEDAEGHWLLKFRHTYDPKDMGKVEYRYNEVARQCGIDVSDFKLVNGKYFACKRFDIKDGKRLHVLTAGGMLCLSLANPTLDYANLLALTGYLTKSEAAVKEMYRRMAFNYFTGNKDDHCKNFSYLCENGKWSLAPAYDLTLCSEGYNGEHATSVNSKGYPTWEDMILVGRKIHLREEDCENLLREVYENSKPLYVDEWKDCR
ncbi:MAG: HipA domain-containing protein [Bacteroides sp.]|nr:HipA domain-containing protein [Bacteroides sp.]